MSNYDTLCKVKDNGKLYIWKIEFLEDNTMKVTHGQYGGKMISHEKEVIPKAKRNYVEQFNLIASRKWNDKIEKEGYITLIEYENNLKKAKNTDINKAEECLQIIRPMLAQTFDKKKYIGNKNVKK